MIPVYNKEKNLSVLQGELSSALREISSYEIIYVGDGRKDSSLDVLSKIKSCPPEGKVVGFTNCYGQTQAMQAGIDYASGDVLVFLDSDLQNDPKDIPIFKKNFLGRGMGQSVALHPCCACYCGRSIDVKGVDCRENNPYILQRSG